MEQSVILVSDRSAVRTLTLNRESKLNAANDDLLLTLTDELKRADADPSVRVVVITGAGRGFCAGQDLGDVSGRGMTFTEHLNHTYNPLVRTIRGLSKPVISAVNGVAAGAGLAVPGQAVLFGLVVYLVAQKLFQDIKVQPPFAKGFGEKVV